MDVYSRVDYLEKQVDFLNERVDTLNEKVDALTEFMTMLVEMVDGLDNSRTQHLLDVLQDVLQ